MEKVKRFEIGCNLCSNSYTEIRACCVEKVKVYLKEYVHRYVEDVPQSANVQAALWHLPFCMRVGPPAPGNDLR